MHALQVNGAHSVQRSGMTAGLPGREPERHAHLARHAPAVPPKCRTSEPPAHRCWPLQDPQEQHPGQVSKPPQQAAAQHRAQLPLCKATLGAVCSRGHCSRQVDCLVCKQLGSSRTLARHGITVVLDLTGGMCNSVGNQHPETDFYLRPAK